MKTGNFLGQDFQITLGELYFENVEIGYKMSDDSQPSIEWVGEIDQDGEVFEIEYKEEEIIELIKTYHND